MSTPEERPAPTGPPPAGHYRVDPSRSTINFATRHLFGLGGVTGTFRLREGEVTVGDPVTTSTANAVVDAASFETGNARRDGDVRSAKYLDTASHPDITFTSTSIGPRDGGWAVAGTVTANGVSAPVEIVVDPVEEGDEVRLRGTARIDRYAHGVTAGKGMAGRWLDLTIDAVAQR